MNPRDVHPLTHLWPSSPAPPNEDRNFGEYWNTLRNLRKKWRQKHNPAKVARDRWRRNLYKRRRLPTWEELERWEELQRRGRK